MSISTSAQVNSSGITAPVFQDILNSFFFSYQGIMGSDAVITNDSKMGQLFSVIAAAQNDSNSLCIQVYNGFSPRYSTGTYLSSLVQINGISREVPTNSTTIVRCTGVAGTNITNGVVQDLNNNLWNLADFTIPVTPDYVDVLATCQTLGQILAPAGTINIINNPQLGWQTAVSQSDATPGNPVETDYALRNRQALSTSFPALSTYEAILAGILNIPGVTFCELYENATSTIDINGIPPYSIAVVVDGGDPTSIATVIADKKAPGVGTYGNLTEYVFNSGFTLPISFSPVAQVLVGVVITITPLPGYTSQDLTNLNNNILNYISGLGIGDTVFVNNCIAASADQLFNIQNLTLNIISGIASLDVFGNIIIPYNGISEIVGSNILVVVL